MPCAHVGYRRLQRNASDWQVHVVTERDVRWNALVITKCLLELAHDVLGAIRAVVVDDDNLIVDGTAHGGRT